jgi:hypothetical protein
MTAKGTLAHLLVPSFVLSVKLTPEALDTLSNFKFNSYEVIYVGKTISGMIHVQALPARWALA